ncbi:LuxR C-terminal-related transcriptional regulator [Lentzea sp. NPDC005914]|uniref:ATP-binding protein n=1 Tax=Lentzea sp. NPDC005914 TaxID=3154572 RepID=UPI0033CCA9D2
MDRVKIGKLPAELTSFVGRRREVGDVKRLLTQGRLVTLTGVGGTGKTRLAQRVATELRRAFPHGVWFVDLPHRNGTDQPATEAHDPDVLACLVGAALGLPMQSALPPLRLLADQLAARHMLLVLDNCEQLIPACATLVDTLLRTCPEQRILATSRELLGIAGELTYAVPPLPTPESQTSPDLKELSRNESVALFVTRAEVAETGFQLTEQNRAAVADICRQLDGLPLAIELAAARIRVLTPLQIVDRLGDRFALLSSSERAAPHRQQTLRACVGWSFDLCSPSERSLWARLSVFDGGFQLAAVEGICADDTLPEAGILDLVTGLVHKSILTFDNRGAFARYRMLETIRQYGQEELGRRGEAASLRRRHADWYTSRADEAERDWFGPDQDRWCQWLWAEHGNLRVAFDFCLSVPDGRERALHLAGTLWFYWLVFGLVSEGRTWLRRALEANAERTRDRAVAQWIDGHLAFVQGDLDTADAQLEAARDLARELGDELTQARAVKRLGAVAMFRGDHELANALLTDALARFEALGEQGASVAHARIGLAMNSYLQGDFAAAVQQDQQVLAICRPRGDRYLLAHGLNNLARVEFALGKLESASAHAHEALKLGRSLPDAMTLMFSLDLLTEITAAAGDYERAATLIGAARNRWQVLSSVRHWTVLAEPHREWVDRTRQALGDAAFAAAVRRGSDFAIDDVISYALGEYVEPSPDPDTITPDVRLTRRESQIAELVAQGMSNRQIAAQLVISQRTAEGHIERIMQKLGCNSRTQIVRWFHDR